MRVYTKISQNKVSLGMLHEKKHASLKADRFFTIPTSCVDHWDIETGPGPPSCDVGTAKIYQNMVNIFNWWGKTSHKHHFCIFLWLYDKGRVLAYLNMFRLSNGFGMHRTILQTGSNTGHPHEYKMKVSWNGGFLIPPNHPIFSIAFQWKTL